ncbi:MAG: SET domain-containing protein [Ferruginibacter sp.]|nr:SET domain-containing protein [Ferruginibacter sp.]
MNKEELLKELTHNCYVMLKPSAVAGIGVFAICDIPKGCRNMFTAPNPNDQWITLSKQDVEALPKPAQHLVTNYCLFDEDENYFVPSEGFKKIDVSLFINHSDTANIISINGGDYFETTRDIQAGEELFLDYGEIV